MSATRQTTQDATITAPPPPDLAVMRETTQIVLASGWGPRTLPDDDLATLTDTLRGHIELLAPEVEQAARRLPEGAVTRHGALDCASEALGKLRAPRLGFAPQVGTVAYAQKLARVLSALCDHYEITSAGIVETPEQAAIERLTAHQLSCRTCKAVDAEGVNLALPCAEEDRLDAEYRQARAQARAQKPVLLGGRRRTTEVPT